MSIQLYVYIYIYVCVCVRKICRDTFGHDLDKWQMCSISMLSCCWAMWTTHNNHDIWRFPKIGVPKVIISSVYRNHPFVFRKHQVINSQIENRTVYKFIDGIFPELNHPAIGVPPSLWNPLSLGVFSDGFSPQLVGGGKASTEDGVTHCYKN